MTLEKPSQDKPTLKALRESVNLTQPELSRRINVGIRIIGDWESGRKIPRFDNAVALAGELGVSLRVLAKVMGLDVSKIPNDEL
ncbi:helix-turn-helix domain-containing protein [Microcoleus sp. ZQ-A2]|jgi:transcriptional regulator with XRE-family HTH domain|nr:helix-turn-helix transcriptional regulator [Microcoleus sp. FACHB-1]